MFDSARIKLTLWYTLSVMAISLIFSGVIYHLIMREVAWIGATQRSRIERGIKMRLHPSVRDALRQMELSPFTEPDITTQVKRRIIIGIVSINGALFIASLGLGYFLAGKTLSPIQEMMDDQYRFISDASHELKTPIASLKAAFEVYLRGKYEGISASRSLIAESLIEIKRLQNLVESMMELIRSGGTKDVASFTSFDLAEAMQKNIDFLNPIAITKKIRIHSQLSICSIYADFEGIKKLTLILLDNAIKYTPPGGDITITLEKKKKTATLTVKDTGIGIEARDIPYIFDRFYRSDRARSRDNQKAGGYGLGLAIAREIVKVHKGTIAVKSKKDKGTQMTVTLPC